MEGSVFGGMEVEGRASVTEPKLKSILRGGKVRNEEIKNFPFSLPWPRRLLSRHVSSRPLFCVCPNGDVRCPERGFGLYGDGLAPVCW